MVTDPLENAWMVKPIVTATEKNTEKNYVYTNTTDTYPDGLYINGTVRKIMTGRSAVEQIKENHKRMTHKEWLDKLSRDELVFRLFEKPYSGKSCYQCVHYHRDANGDFMCYSAEHESDCREDFNNWLNELMEE